MSTTLPVKEIIAHTKERMNKSIHAYKEHLASIRTGQASAQMFEHIPVECYGTTTPLNQLGSISIPEPRLIVIQAWDANILSDIEKAIIKEDLSVNPQNDGKVIRIQIPPLTDETRAQNIKQAKQIAEEAKVATRNIRRDANDKLKKMQTNGEISEDDLKTSEKEIQELTNTISDVIQHTLEHKEKGISNI